MLATSAELQPFSHDRHFSVSAQAADGYRLQVIDEIIVIGSNGQIVGVERPVLHLRERRRKRPMLAPVLSTPRRQDALRFLWGPGRSVLGLSGSRPGPADEARADQEHQRFKALHHRILEGVGDIALQAFLRFLERETASAIRAFPALAERPRAKLAFRFQYDEHFLHERHAAQLAWKRFLTARPPSADQRFPLAADRA